jgi:hypothetical protein
MKFMKYAFLSKPIALLLFLSLNAEANLLSNPGFENSLTDWQFTEGVSIDTIASTPNAYEGSNFIFAADNTQFSIWQTIDLLSAGFTATAIDTGTTGLIFGGWQSGFHGQDTGQISISLFGQDMTQIGGAELSPFTSSKNWAEQSGTTDLLSGTRFIRYDCVGIRGYGVNNDAYLDAAYLNVSNVPVPASIYLFGSALLGLASLKRKKQ